MNTQKIWHLLFYIMLSYCAAGTVYISLAVGKMLVPYPTHAGNLVYILEGNLSRPYICRTLLLIIARIIDFITPESFQQLVVGMFNGNVIFPLSKVYRNIALTTPQHLYPISIMIMTMWLSLVTYGITIRKLYKHIYPPQKSMAPIVAIFGVLAMLPIIDTDAKSYDHATLALSALCFLFSYERKWAKYLICLILATINKETAFLQIAACVLMHKDLWSDKKFQRFVMLQILIYVAITGFIQWWFMNVHGSYVIKSFSEVFDVFLDLRRPSTAIPVVLITYFIFTAWHEIPVPIRRCLWLLPLQVFLYCVCGKRLEYRVFYDLFPLLLLTAGYGAFRIPPNSTLKT